MAESFLLVTEDSIYIPGDERSRTNPGHGYPESTERVNHVRRFASLDELVKHVEMWKPQNPIAYKVTETYTFKPSVKLVVTKEE